MIESSGTEVMSDALRRSSDAVMIGVVLLLDDSMISETEGGWMMSWARGVEGEDVKER